ncbi:hypothetical protein [Nitratifractor sp.]
MKILYIKAEDGLVDYILDFIKKLPKKKIFFEVKEEKSEREGSKKAQSRFSALKLDTKNFRFDRDLAHER